MNIYQLPEKVNRNRVKKKRDISILRYNITGVHITKNGLGKVAIIYKKK
jgi:hypothetical protein